MYRSISFSSICTVITGSPFWLINVLISFKRLGQKAEESTVVDTVKALSGTISPLDDVNNLSVLLLQPYNDNIKAVAKSVILLFIVKILNCDKDLCVN